MKRFLLFLAAGLLVYASSPAQKALIQFTFTGTLNGQHVDLDSVRVRNLTQACDTVIFAPDTLLELAYTGVGLPGSIYMPDEFRVSQQLSNSGEQATFVRICLPENGDVLFNLYDISGREILHQSQYLMAGDHVFRFSAGKEGVYVLKARWRGQVQSVKLMNIRSNASKACEFVYIGANGNGRNPKWAPLTGGFVFIPGNTLKITAYTDTLFQDSIVAPTVSQSFSFGFTYDPCPTSIIYGGQTYTTVQIGTQCWLRENLNIGVMVTSVNTGTAHSECSNNGIIEKYCYDNDTNMCALYGGLYDWNEMMQYDTTPGVQGICPSGWHMATINDWSTMVTACGGVNAAGDAIKEAGTVHWAPPNSTATNSSGFTALPAGRRSEAGSFSYITNNTWWWKANQHDADWAVYEGAGTNWSYVVSGYNYSKMRGLSVRCIKD